MSIHSIDNTTFAGKPLNKAKRVLIMVHGRGASAAKILTLADQLNVADFGILHFP